MSKPLLQIRNISKSFGSKKIFDEASVNISEKQRIGVIGRNGAGKSTLFKMILGKEELDYGEIAHMPDLQLGYIEQHDPFLHGETILEFLERYTGKPEWECAKVASQFQLKGEMLNRPITDLSGGYQMRVKLTATLLFEPNLLLLDEPTNFLDLSTLILLENFLRNFRGAFMVITHDREFIKRTAEAILDVENGKLFFYPEPLEDYLEFKATQKASAALTNQGIERKQKQLQTFVDRFGAKASMAASAQNKLKQIERLNNKKIDIANPFSNIKMRIPKVEGKVGNAVSCKNLSVGYKLKDQEAIDIKNSPREGWQFVGTDGVLETQMSKDTQTKIIATDINFEIDRGQKVAILGDNGQGKSTLLKTLAGQLEPLSGKSEWKNNLKISYYNQHVHQALPHEDTVFGYLKKVSLTGRDEDVYEMLGNFLFGRNDYTKLIGVLSGGEKARLCLAGMFLGKADVYLLDEPTNHLDFETVEAMGAALREFNGTVFAVSHDRTFVNLLATDILEVKNGRVKRILGNYEDYVWRLEQEAKELNTQANQTANSGNQENGQFSSKPKPDKENRKRIYELRKELSKIEKKIEKLKQARELDPTNWQNHTDLETAETKWLEIQTEVEGLG